MKLSVITVNFNNKEGLKKTIKSVIEQEFIDFEFIIIDGGSTDGSFEVIRENSSNITYWVSERDGGIYNAMNKGVDVANGEYCIFMNSGDCFCNSQVLKRIFRKNSLSDIICGNTITDQLISPPNEITMDFLFRSAICHQCAFIKRNLLLKYKYDETLKIVADRKFFIQSLVFENCSYEAVDVDVVFYDINGYSSKNRVLSELEFYKVLEEMLPKRIRDDYGKNDFGILYGESYYEKLFYEIGKRKYKFSIYVIVVAIMRILSVFRKSARFVRCFPSKI